MPDKEIVAAVRTRLIGRIGETRYDLWFGSQTRLVPQGDALLVLAPNRFYQDWLRRNFRDDLASSFREATGRVARLEFRIAEGKIAEGKGAKPPGGDDDAAPNGDHDDDAPLSRNQTPQAAQPAEPATLPDIRAAQRPRFSVARPDDYGEHGNDRSHSRGSSSAHGRQRRLAQLDALVPGDCNRLALQAARMILDQPGKISPLFIHGPTAIGKSHLLEGIYDESRGRSRGQAVYLSAEQFTNAFVEALQGSGLPNFRRKHRGVQWLLLDDVQFFCGKRATVTELLHTIDTFLREGKQLVLAADRPPQGLPGLSEELVTRLQSGLTCAMQPPEQEVRLGIVRGMAVELELSLPSGVAEFIAASLTSHARELSGALKLLKVTCQARGCALTLTLAQETLVEMIRAGAPAVGLSEIEQAVCSVFGLEPKALRTGDGSRGVSHPRMLAMWLARKHTRAALTEIGRYFGRRSHSTVISAQKKVDGWMMRSASLRVSDHDCPADEAIRRIEAQLKAG